MRNGLLDSYIYQNKQSQMFVYHMPKQISYCQSKDISGYKIVTRNTAHLYKSKAKYDST